jgi:hypothetical protein
LPDGSGQVIAGYVQKCEVVGYCCGIAFVGTGIGGVALDCEV